MNEISKKMWSDVLKEWMPLIIALLTILASFWTFSKTEESKREYQEYIRKEQKYSELIENMRGFVDGYDNPIMKEQFIIKVNECWMYCSDDVIRKANIFLASVKEGASTTPEAATEAYAETIAAIRKDLIKETSLTSKDLMILKVNK